MFHCHHVLLCHPFTAVAEEEVQADPRSRSVSFSGLAPHRSAANNMTNTPENQSTPGILAT